MEHEISQAYPRPIRVEQKSFLTVGAYESELMANDVSNYKNKIKATLLKPIQKEAEAFVIDSNKLFNLILNGSQRGILKR